MCVSCAEAVSSLTQSMVPIDPLPFAACRSPLSLIPSPVISLTCTIQLCHERAKRINQIINYYNSSFNQLNGFLCCITLFTLAQIYLIIFVFQTFHFTADFWLIAGELCVLKIVLISDFLQQETTFEYVET